MLRTPNVKNLRLQTPAAEPSRAKNLRLTSHRVGCHLPVPSGSATTRLSREFAPSTVHVPISLSYFEGTDPREPGMPNSPPLVGTPREQYELGLTAKE